MLYGGGRDLMCGLELVGAMNMQYSIFNMLYFSKRLRYLRLLALTFDCTIACCVASSSLARIAS